MQFASLMNKRQSTYYVGSSDRPSTYFFLQNSLLLIAIAEKEAFLSFATFIVHLAVGLLRTSNYWTHQFPYYWSPYKQKKKSMALVEWIPITFLPQMQKKVQRLRPQHLPTSAKRALRIPITDLCNTALYLLTTCLKVLNLWITTVTTVFKLTYCTTVYKGIPWPWDHGSATTTINNRESALWSMVFYALLWVSARLRLWSAWWRDIFAYDVCVILWFQI